MSLTPALQRLEALDVAGLQRGGIGLAMADVRELRRFADQLEVRIAGRLAELGEPVADELRSHGYSSPQASAIERAAQTIAEVPGLAEALSARRIGVEHVNGYRRVERTLTDEQRPRLRERVGEALESSWSTPEQFTRRVAAIARTLRLDDGEGHAEQQRADRACRWGYRRDGMGFVSGVFDPETMARLAAMLGAQRDQLLHDDPSLTQEQAAADALVNLILNGGRTMHHGRTEVVVFVDWESLLRGAHAGGVSYLSGGAHLPVSAVRRLCCEAEIMPMVLSGDGQPLDLGRSQRLASRAQRLALRTLYATCAHPGCEVRFDDCTIHHIDWWEHGGSTDLARMVPLCSRHHHLVHEGGWQLEIDDRRTITVRRPDGAVEWTVPWEPPPGEHPGHRHRHRGRPPDQRPVAA